MPLPPIAFSTTCDIYRPYSATTPTSQGVACSLTPYLAGQRIGGSPPPMYYTHEMICGTNVDIRDGCARQTNLAQQQFGMGDKVVIPSGDITQNTTYAVTWVEWCLRGTTAEHKKVYLSRDVPKWGNTTSP